VQIAEGLDFEILAAGRSPRNPSELLSSPHFERLLRNVRENFDWVVIDSPPLMATADATIIAPLVDGIILVVRANKTPSKLIKDAIARLSRDKICGVILNRIEHLHSSRYYYHYYGKPGKPRE
jgi:capsular exopolysaccharide synthesis family protein